MEELEIGNQEIRELSRLIRGLGVFKNLTIGLIDEVCEEMQLFRYQGDEVVIEEGEPGKGFFLIKDGTLRVLQQKKVGMGGLRKEQVLVNTMRSGDFFGEIALTSTWSHTATVQCERPTDLYMLSASSFQQIMGQNDSFAGMVEEASYDRLKNSKEQLGDRGVSHRNRPRRAAPRVAPSPRPTKHNQHAPPPAAKPRVDAGIDPWQILGVAKGASKSEIKRAYQEKIRLFHPDRHQLMGPELQARAEEQTKMLNLAYSTLR